MFMSSYIVSCLHFSVMYEGKLVCSAYEAFGVKLISFG